MLVSRAGRYYLGALPQGVNVVPYVSDTEPLLPARFDLREYSGPSRRAASAQGDLSYVVDAAARERASTTHQALVELVASKVRSSGAVPRCNRYVDLAAVVSGQPFIFEVKSPTPGNTRDQIRRGVSQLYEYRYLQAADDARLVLVIENPIPPELGYMVDYLVSDRQIGVVWDDDRRTLHCDARQRDDLAFLL